MAGEDPSHANGWWQLIQLTRYQLHAYQIKVSYWKDWLETNTNLSSKDIYALSRKDVVRPKNLFRFGGFQKRILVELVYCIKFWINNFPEAVGVSATIGPQDLMIWVSQYAKKHSVIAFHSYMQTQEKHDNSMSSRNAGAIALSPPGNFQGRHYL